MKKQVVSFGWVVVVAVVAFAAGAPAAWASSSNVVSVIKAQDQILNSAPATKGLAKFNLRALPTAATAKAALPDLTAFTNLVKKDSDAVAKATTDSVRQQSGKSDYVRGERIQVRGFIDLQHALKTDAAGDHPKAAEQYAAGQRLLNAGNVIANHGDRLLGLATHY